MGEASGPGASPGPLAGLSFRPVGTAGRPDGELLDPADLTPEQLGGFFEGWPDPPGPERLRAILAGSAAAELCLDLAGPEPRVVGLLNGLTDGVLHLYLPLLEVHASHRGRGIARHLVERMLARFGDLYAVDLVCDDDVAPLYERLGLTRVTGMALRRYDLQAAR